MIWAGLNIRAQALRPRPDVVFPTVTTAPVTDEQTSTRSQTATRATVASETQSYPAKGAKGDTIGHLTIPALDRRLPIIEGTGVAELKKGVGHFSQSVLPGVKDNCVLSGHRDTVFTGLGKLKKGDQFIVETAAGRFTYAIRRTRIVDKDDRTVIVPTDHAVLTVTTCYPFNYVGSAPDRYILSADLITVE